MFGAAVRVAAPRCSCASIRTLSTGCSETFTVFDRNAKLMQKERAAAREDIHLYDYLKEEVIYIVICIETDYFTYSGWNDMYYILLLIAALL
jgi:hypothetical protein